MSEGEGAEETEREPEKLGLRGGKKAGTIMRGGIGHWRGCRGERQVPEGLPKLWRQECIGTFSVHSDAGGD